MDSLLREFWYLAVAGRALRPGKTLAVSLLGEAMLLGRRRDGSVFAVGERCPHRGMPMRHGSFDGETLRCCYHGWAFRSSDGCCTEIPSLAPDEVVDPSRFRLKTWPCREVQGNIWVFVGGGMPGEVPVVPAFAVDAVPQVSTTMRFPCGIDLAATGFFDPGHPAFVHTSKWWKSNPAANLRLKEKQFEPAGMGFRMLRHHLQHGANPYRILGRNVHVDIGISLPGVRIEHIEGDRHAACVLAAATPVSATETDVHYRGYWTPRWLDPLRPVATWMARDFLNQDRMVAVKMADNPEPASPMFVGGADVQVRWYLRLKREYLAASAGRAGVCQSAAGDDVAVAELMQSSCAFFVVVLNRLGGRGKPGHDEGWGGRGGGGWRRGAGRGTARRATLLREDDVRDEPDPDPWCSAGAAADGQCAIRQGSVVRSAERAGDL